MVGQILRKDYGLNNVKLEQAVILSNGHLKRANFMPFLSTAGSHTKALFVFPGKQAEYRVKKA